MELKGHAGVDGEIRTLVSPRSARTISTSLHVSDQHHPSSTFDAIANFQQTIAVHRDRNIRRVHVTLRYHGCADVCASAHRQRRPPECQRNGRTIHHDPKRVKSESATESQSNCKCFRAVWLYLAFPSMSATRLYLDGYLMRGVRTRICP